MREIAVTITPLQAESIMRNLSSGLVNITIKRTMTKGERQGGGFLPLILAAAPAIAAAVGTGALSGAAGFGTNALLNEITGGGRASSGPTVTLSKTQWDRLTNSKGAGGIIMNFKVSKSKNMAHGQAGGSLSGKILPMLVKALTPVASAAGNAMGKAAIKAGKRLATRGVKAGERKIGTFIDGNTTTGGRRPIIKAPAPMYMGHVEDDPFGGMGVLDDISQVGRAVTGYGKRATSKAMRPLNTGMYLANNVPRIVKNGRAVYDDAYTTGMTAKNMMGLGYKLAGEGYKLAGGGKKRTVRK